MGKTQKVRYQEFKSRFIATAGNVIMHQEAWLSLFEGIGLRQVPHWRRDLEEANKQSYGIGPSYLPNDVLDGLLRWSFFGKATDLQPCIEWFSQRVHEEWYQATHPRTQPQQSKTNRQIGYIYVIQAGDSYKIGKSIRPGNRIKTHRASNPHTVKVIFQAHVDEYSYVEHSLHELFIEKQVREEWFSLEPSDLDTIREYLQQHLVQGEVVNE